jgi:hypothetical protein
VDQQYSVARRFKRYKVEVRVKVSLVRDGEHSLLYGQGSDVSEGGFAAYLPSEFAVGEVLDAELRLPYTKAPIQVKVAVRNRNGFRYGLEIVHIETQERETLARSLKALSLIQH